MNTKDKATVSLCSWTSALVLGLCVSNQAHSQSPNESVRVVIGEEDRRPSFDRSIGRLRKTRKGYEFCTATLIGRSCALTAGHCIRVTEVLEFDLEHVANTFTWATPENTYRVDLESRVFLNDGKGRDWGVFRLHPNDKTGRLPGQERPPYPVSFEKAQDGAIIDITGYGAAENEYSFHQQSSSGILNTLDEDGSLLKWLEHDADTGSSSSGSAIIDNETGHIVGVHTHGDSDRLVNSGTDISQSPELKEAILSCLANDLGTLD